MMGYNRNSKKTRLMRSVEANKGQLLEDLLPDLINNGGFTTTCQELGVSKATLGYWLLRLGIQVRTVALRPGEDIEIKNAREVRKLDGT